MGEEAQGSSEKAYTREKILKVCRSQLSHQFVANQVIDKSLITKGLYLVLIVSFS